MDFEDSIVHKLSKCLNVDPQDFGIALSLTYALHGLLATFYKPAAVKNKIIVLESEFTSDIFAVESWIELFGFNKETHCIRAKVSDIDH